MKIKSMFLVYSLFANSLFAADWGYDRHNGPNMWSSLDSRYKLCGNGIEQSPINIKDSITKNTNNELFLLYGTNSTSIVNNGHSIEVKFDNAGGVVYKNTQYNLIQLHFHTPSENMINDKQYPMEMHLVHSDNKGNLLVVGVLFKEGLENDEIRGIISKSSTHVDYAERIKKVFIMDLLPKSKGYYAFYGSLTTPPCTENVQWIVLKEAVEASRDQIDILHSILHNVARDIQPINKRVILSAS